MKNEITFEWTVEDIDKNGDIINSDFADTLQEFATTDFEGKDFGVVRDRGSEERGLICRAWAYVKDGKLPSYFTDAAGIAIAKVPQKFHNELKEFLNTKNIKS